MAMGVRSSGLSCYTRKEGAHRPADATIRIFVGWRGVNGARLGLRCRRRTCHCSTSLPRHCVRPATRHEGPPDSLPRFRIERGQFFNDAVGFDNGQNPLDPRRIVAKRRSRLFQSGTLAKVRHIHNFSMFEPLGTQQARRISIWVGWKRLLSLRARSFGLERGKRESGVNS